MTRTSRHHTTSTRQNTRREANLFAEFRSRDLSLCQYLSWYFSPSTRFEGVQTHRPKLFNSTWSSLKRVLDIILRLAREHGAQSRSRINHCHRRACLIFQRQNTQILYGYLNAIDGGTSTLITEPSPWQSFLEG
ncbi:BQ5605_C007g04889 [Microbotryum silenes-dioicae]|uniref:BQ5605_C007g04889 protein n=1 Tax=Microbotryum silenes-dioicae TaxID=796604 RepID=A0A2X0MVC6_9BASI|nr:BQ5605_C007g04889 [Microbotryum silenes-dioicae]